MVRHRTLGPPAFKPGLSSPRGIYGLLIFGLLVLCSHSLAVAQEANSRADILIRARQEKSQKLTEEKSYPAEQALQRFQDIGLLDPNKRALWIRIGGMPTGQGFALGPQYRNPRLFNNHVTLRTSLAGSLSKAWLADLQLTTRNIADDHIYGDFLVQHLNLPRLEYFGPGPDSEKDDRTNYRLETTTGMGTLGVRPVKPLSFFVTGGYLKPNVGPGNRENYPSTETIFNPVTTPGLFDQTDFLIGGVGASIDYRDYPSPRRGGFYSAQFKSYDDRGLNRYNFRWLELEAQQYIPFFQDRRVIALRARAIMTYTNGYGQSVPFYLQPQVGGSDDVRGFRPYRFYDDNSIVVNAEYRWEVFAGLDMALFFDAGKVVPKRSQVNFHELETAAGFGFRFNARNAVFMRVDMGFSHEGAMIWLKFANPF